MNLVLAFTVLVAVFLAVDASAGTVPPSPAEPVAASAGQGGKAAADQDEDEASAKKGGQPTGSKFTIQERRAMVRSHNEVRTAVGVAPLKWSPDLAAFAQKWADHIATTNCVAQHRPGNAEWPRPYGEEVYGGKGPTAGPAEAFTMWESSKKFYNGQPVSASDLRAANYTQLVWSATTQFGCGKAVCKDGTVIVICNYDPKGNVVGQKPY